MPDGDVPRLSIGTIAILTVGSYIAGYMRDAGLSAWGIKEVERHILLQVVTREIEGVETPVLHCVEAYRGRPAVATSTCWNSFCLMVGSLR